MIVAVCVDDKGGMMFNKRRQSQDRVLRQHLRDLADGRTIWMNAYSAGLFQKDKETVDGEAQSQQQDDEKGPKICVAEDFLAQAGDGEFCFVENQGVLEYKEKIEAVVLYKWNRVYPSDRFFDLDLEEKEWDLVKSEEFAGSSHEKITMEYYDTRVKRSEQSGIIGAKRL